MKNHAANNSVPVGLPLLVGLCLTTGFCSGATVASLRTLGGPMLEAKAVNRAGQIAGFSTLSGGEQHGFLNSAGVTHNLGTLGGVTSAAFGLNDAGWVVGESEIESGQETHAFLFAGATLIDLGTLGGTFSAASAVNTRGQVVGVASLPGDRESHAFLYDTNGVLRDLGTLSQGRSFARGINNRGQVVGDSTDLSGNTVAFLWQDGVMIGLTLGGTAFGYAINDAGQVVGESYGDTGEYHAFLHSGGRVIDLGTLGGTYSVAYTLNEAGQVIGDSTTEGDRETHGFICTGGALTDLGTLGGPYSSAHAINHLGQVVGDSTDPDWNSIAFLWQNGVMYDLNRVLPPNSGWVLETAWYINDAGQVVGTGRFQGNYSWYVLTLGQANHPPVADAGADQTVECGVPVSLDGRGSTDPDGDALACEWREGDTTLATEVQASVRLGAGGHTLTLRVTDPSGASSEDTVLVTVSDTSAPTIRSAAVTPSNLTPANHRMVPVTVIVVAEDNCDPAPNSRIVSIASSDPVTSQGDKTSPDWRITGQLTAELRAERSKGNVPRFYTLKIVCADASGNTTETTLTVGVNADGSPAAASSKIKKTAVKK
jgi:probable HAF family extracellular repeat protein